MVEKWLKNGLPPEQLCHTLYGMKMTMHIDEGLLNRVIALYGCASKTEAVNRALSTRSRTLW